jgi:hypothetical protein
LERGKEGEREKEGESCMRKEGRKEGSMKGGSYSDTIEIRI